MRQAADHAPLPPPKPMLRRPRAPPLPAMPRNGAPARSCALPGWAGVRPHLGNPQRRSPGATQPRRRRGPGPRASCPHVPAHRSIAAEGAVVAPRPRAPRIPAMPRNGARARFPGARASRPHIGNPQRRSPGATQPRRRRGPGPRASCPHVPAHRSVAGEGAVVTPLPPANERNCRDMRARRPGAQAVRACGAFAGEARFPGSRASRQPPSPADPRNTPQQRPSALPGWAGVSPARWQPARRRRRKRNPAEGGARDRGHPARTFPRGAALPRRAQ